MCVYVSVCDCVWLCVYLFWVCEKAIRENDWYAYLELSFKATSKNETGQVSFKVKVASLVNKWMPKSSFLVFSPRPFYGGSLGAGEQPSTETTLTEEPTWGLY